MTDLIINKVSYLTFLKKYSLTINKEIKLYDIKFTLLLPPASLNKIEVGMEVYVREDAENICGGIIEGIEYKKLNNELIEVYVQCIDFSYYAQVRTTTPLLGDNPNLDNLGEMVRGYMEKLTIYDITEGKIEANLQVAELEEDTEEGKVKDKLDKVAELTKSTWWIDWNKCLWFGKGVINSKTFNTPLNLEEQMNVSVKKDIKDYANKIKVVGGEPEEEVSEKYLSEDGYIYVELMDTEEIERMKNLLGGDGIFEKTETKGDLTSLYYVQKYATELMEKYSNPPIELEFLTFIKSYNPGDFIYVDSPLYGLKNKKFCIDGVEAYYLSDSDNVLVYRIKASLRNTNIPKEDLYEYLKRVNDKKVSTETKKPNVFTEDINVQIQNVISTSADIIIK